MRVAKEHDDTTFTSISTYFVNGSHCKYGKSGYFDFSCITADCSTCNGIIHLPMLEKTCASEKVITYYQYQSVPYVNKQGKSKSRTERVQFETSVNACKDMLDEMSELYLIHRFDVNHDKFIWPHC